MNYCEDLIKAELKSADIIPKDTICANCKKHKGTHFWVGSEGVMAYIHGEHQIWCKCCTIKAQLTYAEEASKNIPKLKEQLQRLICK